MAIIWANGIINRDELAEELGIPLRLLTYVLYGKHPENFYHTFDIPKKDGSSRHISAPELELKKIQTRLSESLQSFTKRIYDESGITPHMSQAFEKGKSIITNAQIHRNKAFVYNFDLEDFFDSFHFGRVVGFFEKNKYFQMPKDMAIILAQLTCYQGHLPQGAPSSPIITNLIAQVLDQHLLKVARSYHLDYTRYADDLTFSTNDRAFLVQQENFLLDVTKTVQKCGFKINEKKTRLQYKDSRQEVTGLIVNKKLNVKREYSKNTRAMAHSLYTTGTFQINGVEGTLAQLEGRFAFIDQIDKYNNKKNNKSAKDRRLTGREREFLTFLIYKHFFVTEFPVIVTEGKTDVTYLKSALKSMSKDFPTLIEERSQGGFNYKVRFLRRSPKLQYFMNINLFGADTMEHIYDCLTDQTITKLREFGRIPKRPTFLLFDHELQNKKPKKPLKKVC